MNKIPPKNHKIKICGITNKKDAFAIARLKPDYLGFIFNYPKSPRNVKNNFVRDIILLLRKKYKNKIRFVGVLVNQEVREVQRIMEICNLDIVQLHGDETPAYINELKKICNKEIWKTVILKTKTDKEKIKKYRHVADKILFDSGKGNGNKIKSYLLKGQQTDILAGGLGVHNIENVLAIVSPDIIDANSKLESSPGKKNIRLVAEFINKVRKV